MKQILTRPTTIAAIAVGIFVVAFVPSLVATYWIFLCTAGLLTGVTAMGLSVIIGWIGEITLAGAGLLGASVYVTGYLAREGTSNWNGWPFIPAAIIGVICGILLSALIAVPTARFSGVYLLVLTMGLQITLERTLFSFPWIVGGFGRNVVVTRPKVFGFHFDSDLRYFYLCLFVCAGAMLFLYLLRRSRHGQAMNLVRTDARAAASLGISPWRYKILGFAVAGGLVGVAGAFTAPLYRSPPAVLQFILFQSLFLLAIPVVAGTQTLFGIVAVSVSFALIPSALQDHHLSPYLLGGIGLFVGTVIGPKGLGGVMLEMLQKKKEAGLLAVARGDGTVASDGSQPGGSAFAGEVS